MQRHHKKTFLRCWKGFFELKVAFDDGLSSYICRCCHHKVMKFQEFFRKIAFSRQQQESVLRVKRGKTTAESQSGRSPQTRRDLKKRRIYEDAPAKGPSLSDKPSKTRPRTILPAPSAEGDGKKTKACKENRILSRGLDQRHQNKRKFSRSLVC